MGGGQRGLVIGLLPVAFGQGIPALHHQRVYFLPLTHHPFLKDRDIAHHETGQKFPLIEIKVGLECQRRDSFWSSDEGSAQLLDIQPVGRLLLPGDGLGRNYQIIAQLTPYFG